MQKPVLFLIKAHVGAFTRKDGAVVQAHETKVQAAAAPAPERRSGGPGDGEIGDHEYQAYGVHFRPGDKANDREGNTHTVVEHRGASVRTMGGGAFHPTKLTPVAAPAPAAPASAPAYVKPDHVKTKSDEIDHLTKIAPEKRSVGEKTRLKKIISQGGLGKHSPEYQSHLKSIGNATPALDPHPNVIGKASGKGQHSFQFGGKTYHHTGKEGNSMHDQTPVSEAESDDGHRVWRDDTDRVHADSQEEAKKARGGK